MLMKTRSVLSSEGLLKFGAFILLFLFLTGMLGACRHGDDYDELPQKIADFVSRYYPGEGVQSFAEAGGTYHVRIANGPGITFDSSYEWVSINGYGMPMPQVMLFDQLPPKLYGYLQDSQQLDSVFGMDRDSKRYTLTLLSSTLIYDIATGAISGTVPTS